MPSSRPFRVLYVTVFACLFLGIAVLVSELLIPPKHLVKSDTVGLPTKHVHSVLSQLPVHVRSTITARNFECSREKSCENGACCGPNGYCGYGPSYCGDGCVSGCDAHAECGQFADPPGTGCPLNVCCSKFGFCGVTDEFCDDGCQSGCGHPSPPSGATASNVRNKIIGYYEAWGARRECQQMSPSGIPLDGLTHINFAFAYIEPGTYKITTMDYDTPASLFQSVADVRTSKSGNDDLEIFISVGGWTFSDTGTVTQPLFGEIAAEAQKRQVFANNVADFMDFYGFDGLDLDWEYPGAPDRGGLPQDTENFVMLLKTLRQTFDSRPRKYGLTFTAPTSYWYLRWFDLLGMAEHADWINLMSYDLHGYWDRLSSIGSVVQSHTNLTEIKQAVELFWRVGVPPAKIVLGTGFYGRSFQLKDPECSKPGCPFAGVAKAGRCTQEGGVLSYFEIMDILTEQGDLGVSQSDAGFDHAGVPVHDVESAVKYTTYDHDQWVSYDDNVTFAQKVDWANSVGLNGLMIWSVDLDDSKSTALQGLLERPFGVFQNPERGTLNRNSKSVTQNWARETGQQCFLTNCDTKTEAKKGCTSKAIGGKAGFIQVGTKLCHNNKLQLICCPVTAAPKCQWRGGETGQSCKGQCHAGEVNLKSIRGSDGDGTRKHCNLGWQIFCCVADAWSQLIKDCVYSGCKRDCPSGTEKVAKHYQPFCRDNDHSFEYSGWESYCCPKPTIFTNCHWVGKGDCGDNTCTNSKGEDDGSIELLTDFYGETNDICRVQPRKKVLCCNPPPQNPFLPVPLKNLFPVAPPHDNVVEYDIQYPDGHHYVNPNEAPFGWVIIDGPKSAVSSVTKRDGSHLEFLDCDRVAGSHEQTVRYICIENGNRSNCDDMHEGGLSGTVLKMPDGCGDGHYVVAHDVSVSSNQTLPYWIKQLSGKETTVMELTFSYRFQHVKRDAGLISFRIDYSSVPGYWNTVVASEPKVKKRSFNTRGFEPDLGYAWWKRRIRHVRSLHAYGESYEHITSYIGTHLFSSSLDCDNNGHAYLDIKTTGGLQADVNFGVTIIGRLEPLSVDQVVTFFDSRTSLDLNVEVSASGRIFSNSTEWMPVHKRTTTALFHHPGLCSFTPFLSADVSVTSDVELQGNFSVAYKSSTGLVRQTYPSDIEPASGEAQLSNAAWPFYGNIFAASEGALKINVMPVVGLDLRLDKLGYTKEILGVNITSQVYSYSAIQTNGSAFNASIGSDKIGASVFYAEGLSFGDKWSKDSGVTHPVGHQVGSRLIASGAAGDHHEQQGLGPRPHEIDKYDVSAPLASLKDLLTCPQRKKLDCSVPICLAPGAYNCSDEDTINHRPENTRTANEQSEKFVVSPRSVSNESRSEPPMFVGRTRDFDIIDPDNPSQIRTIIYNNARYPSVGGWTTVDASIYNRALGFANFEDCEIAAIVRRTMGRAPEEPATRQWATEHPIDMQVISRFLAEANRGMLPSGRRATTPAISGRFFVDAFTNTNFLPAARPTMRGNTNPQIFSDRVALALGGTNNHVHFQILEWDLNSAKGQIFGLRNYFSFEKLDGWIESGQLSNLVNLFRNVEGVFNYLNDGAVARAFIETANDLREQFQLADQTWNLAHPNDPIHLAAIWDEWFPDFISEILNRVRTQVVAAQEQISRRLRREGPLPLLQDAFEIIQVYIANILRARIPLEGLATG